MIKLVSESMKNRIHSMKYLTTRFLLITKEKCNFIIEKLGIKHLGQEIRVYDIDQ
jgi:hypothetical protein